MGQRMTGPCSVTIRARIWSHTLNPPVMRQIDQPRHPNRRWNLKWLISAHFALKSAKRYGNAMPRNSSFGSHPPCGSYINPPAKADFGLSNGLGGFFCLAGS